MTQQYQAPQQQFQAQPVKKKHTVRNIFIVLTVLFVAGIGGCAAVMGAVGNEVAKSADSATERNAPRAGAAGKAFTIGSHETLAGWKVVNASGMFSVAGKVKNTSGKTSTAFFHVKVLKGDEVLGNVQCNNSDLEPGQTETLNCIPEGTYSKTYDRITAEATF